MTPFATNEQILLRHDGRWIAKNILDDGSLVTIAMLLNTGTEAGARLAELASDASEELMSAAAVGARYSENDLRVYGGNLVISITAGLTLGPILERRGRATEDVEKLSSAYARAAARVEELRRGERIFFAVPNVPEAGLPESASMAPNALQPPTWTQQAGRFFGTTAGCPWWQNPGNFGG